MSVIRSQWSFSLKSPRLIFETLRRRGNYRLAWPITAAVLAIFAIRGLWPGAASTSTAHSAVDALVETTTFDASQALVGQAAGKFCLLLLEQAQRTLADVHDMRAVFHKRERIEGELHDLNTMQLKVRRAPLSVYMRWHEPYAGREIIWQQGAHDGQILVHAGGWQRKMLPLLKIDPHGERAMEYNRRPVTQIGLWNFNQRLLTNLRNDLDRPNVNMWMAQDRKIGGRDCYCFRIVHPRRQENLSYQRLHVYIDQALALPVACEIYGWSPEGNAADAPLEESYAFVDLALNVGLSDLDFDAKNAEYQFGVR